MNLLAPDKIQHMMGGCIVALVMLPAGWLLAGFVVVVVGLSKEMYDYASGKGTPDVWDAVATIAAGFATIGIHTHDWNSLLY